MAANSSIGGLISGLDTDTIVQKMVSFAQRPVQILQGRQAGFTSELSAWQDVNTRLLALKLKADALSTPAAFKARSATVSDTDALGVSATADAAPGSYTVTVNRLARAEQIQSQGYADTNTTPVGTGSVTVGVGTSAKSIAVDSSNNTLSGLRDAVNRAGVGATASIVDFGSLGAHEYHLVLTSNATGEENAITWTPALAGGSAPSWTTTVEAKDASVTFGSGASATTVTKSSNTVGGVIPGLTLTLKEEDVSKPLQVTVSADTAGIKTKVQDFIGQYNSVIDFMNAQFSFDSETNTGGTLLGDYNLQGVQQDLRSGILSVVPGLPSSMNSLTQIGITSNVNDKLVLDESKLDALLGSDPDGVMKLFAGNGAATDTSVSYLSETSATKATGAGAGYKVRVDAPALQARVTAGAAQTSDLAADEHLTINGTSVTLTAGMTPQQVLDRINSYSDTTGVSAARTGADGTGSGGYLTLTRITYGSKGQVTVVSDVSNGAGTPAADTSGIGKSQLTQAAAAGETGTGTGSAGRDVTGAFGVTVNGVTTWESAAGSGQVLSGNTGNAHTDGLRVRAASATAGEHGEVTLTQGIGETLSHLLEFLTGKNGAVTSAQDTLNQQIDDLKDEITAQNTRISTYEDRIRLQFNDLEAKLGQLQSQGNYLASQITAMSKK